MRCRPSRAGVLTIPRYGVSFYMSSAIGLVVITILLVFVKTEKQVAKKT